MWCGFPVILLTPPNCSFSSNLSHEHSFFTTQLLLTGYFLFLGPSSVNHRDGCVFKSQEISSLWRIRPACLHQQPSTLKSLKSPFFPRGCFRVGLSAYWRVKESSLTSESQQSNREVLNPGVLPSTGLLANQHAGITSTSRRPQREEPVIWFHSSNLGGERLASAEELLVYCQGFNITTC